MIKAGQVYKYTTEPSIRFIVTQDYDYRTRYDYIQNNGCTRSYVWENDLLYKTELIAEYPTWQEAVNSKEFKGE